MIEPTDYQIFNHMAPKEDFCGKCHGDVEPVEYEDYKTYRCVICDFEPEPPGEE